MLTHQIFRAHSPPRNTPLSPVVAHIVLFLPVLSTTNIPTSEPTYSINCTLPLLPRTVVLYISFLHTTVVRVPAFITTNHHPKSTTRRLHSHNLVVQSGNGTEDLPETSSSHFHK